MSQKPSLIVIPNADSNAGPDTNTVANTEVKLASAAGEVDWRPWFAGLHSARAVVRAWRDQDLNTRLERARLFIDAHYDREIDLDRIAHQACLSRYHFLRQFRRRYGMTPHQYLTSKRVYRAQELLESSRLSVTEICLEVGFSSLGSFTSMFRRYVGHPPSRYRAKVHQSLWSPMADIPPPVPWCFAAHFRRPV